MKHCRYAQISLLVLEFFLNCFQNTFCRQNDLVVQPKISPVWASLTFLLAIDMSYKIVPETGLLCRNFSSLYCLEAYETVSEAEERALTYYFNHPSAEVDIYWLEQQAYLKYSFSFSSSLLLYLI